MITGPYIPAAQHRAFELDAPGTWRGVVFRPDGTEAYVTPPRSTKKAALADAKRRCAILNKTNV